MIRLEAVTKRYGAREALVGVSLAVPRGDVVALIGGNGAGKSTALKTVVGIARPGAGRVLVGGVDVTAAPERALALVGYVPQRLAFPEHVSVLDLCHLVGALRGVRRAEVGEALETVGLAPRGRSRVRELSGGQRQRLSLALASLGRPSALVLDEPSISLDAEGAETMCRVIASARARGAAVLFASHHLPDVAALADRAVVLRAGRVSAVADAAILRDSSACEALYRRVRGPEAAHAA